jgi:hypothetical protein
MDRRNRVNDLLGQYHPANQSSNVPSNSSYSTVNATRRNSRDYLDTYSSSRRLSNVSAGDGSPPRAYSRTTSEITRTRSPSRYNPETSYTARSSRFDTGDSTSPYSSRYTPSRDTGTTIPTTTTASSLRSGRTSGADEINRLSRNLERSVSSILSGDYRRARDNTEFIENYASTRANRGQNAANDAPTSSSRLDNTSTEEPPSTGMNNLNVIF